MERRPRLPAGMRHCPRGRVRPLRKEARRALTNGPYSDKAEASDRVTALTRNVSSCFGDKRLIPLLLARLNIEARSILQRCRLGFPPAARGDGLIGADQKIG